MYTYHYTPLLEGYSDINKTCSNQRTSARYVTDSIVCMKQASHAFIFVVKRYLTQASAANHSQIFCKTTCN